MELSREVLQQFIEDLSNAKTYEDLMGKDGAIKKLMGKSFEALLGGELTEHLGYTKNSPEGNNSGNSRNGSSKKTLKNDNGEIELRVPRDRNGTFDPVLVKKYQTTIGDIEPKIISMYAKGMTTRDIQSHIEDLYGLQMSPTFISNVTESIRDLAVEWQSRPLNAMYPVVFFDAIFYKVRHNGKVINKAAYTCLAIDANGYKDFLGIWICETEGANFWRGVFTELRNRGVNDILIACIDGLTGLDDAINSIFPKTEIQLCVVHLIRNSLRYVAHKDRKQFAKELKNVYNAPTEEAALLELEKLEQQWGNKYSYALKGWKEKWHYVATFFQYTDEIRTMIYTTNAVEALHRQFRKVTKSKTLFPNDDALTKALYLAFRDFSKKWTMPVRNWAYIVSQLNIIYGDRFTQHLK